MLANTEVMEMAKRGVPGVWTYGFYDGWVPNYLFFIAHSHNSIGRFYEVQSYGPDTTTVRARATTTSREWFRPNPPLPSIAWGPRNNTNIQESAILIALNHVGRNKDIYLQNYWLKNKRAIQKGLDGPTYAWVIPAGQHRKADAADAVNELRRQGLEIQRAASDFQAGDVQVKAGDYIVRGDQPYRTLADMYFALQNYSPANPRPYDDTGWTFQLMRNVEIAPVTEKSILDQRMALLTSDAKAAGGIEGSGNVLVVEHTTDNNLVRFRYQNANVKMLAAEDDFDAAGHHFRAGAFIIPNADRAKLETSLVDLGLTAWALPEAPSVATHEMDLPRIGYVHSWARTQDEGWVRAVFDTYHIPYTYFGDQKLREGNLRAKYDVIILPSIGGSATSQVNGIPKTDDRPLPYEKTDATPNLGVEDRSDDIRGGMGIEGLSELMKFVEEGGTLITEGATSVIFPDYGLTSGVSVEEPEDLYARGAIFRGIVADQKSPIAYGYDAQVPVYFSQGPVLSAGGGGGGFFGRGGPAGVGQNTTPMATRLHLSPWKQEPGARGRGRQSRGDTTNVGFGFGGRGRFGGSAAGSRPRVVVRFPTDTTQMLLSGLMVGGEALSNRAQVVDAPLGEGHVVMFAIRPFWRWQTQGTFFLGFNTILNWNDLNAGQPASGRQVSDEGGQ